MSDTTTRRVELEQALLDLDEGAMVLEELDGFIAGLLVCPEMIPPRDWFPLAFGFDGGDPPFEDVDHANVVLDLVMEYYNDVVATLLQHPERYRPLFPVYKSNGDVIWELWIDGFAAAVDIRPQAWQVFFEAGGEAKLAMDAMIALVEIARAAERPGDAGSEAALKAAEDVEAISGTAPGVIQHAIVTLHGCRLEMTASASSFSDLPNPFAPTVKIGRNEPCPCGSGKKYKRCCGLN